MVFVVPAILRSPWQDVDFYRGLVVRGRAENLVLRVGIVVFRSISTVNTPPRVSIPNEERRDVEQQHIL